MNIFLFSKDQMDSQGHFILNDKQLDHVKNVLDKKSGDTIFSGELDGKMGHSEIIELANHRALIKSHHIIDPPEYLPINLILALPRPKMLKRILRSVSMLGVKKIYLINSYKVEKSFWQSQLLEIANLNKYLISGLEQSKDTILPEITIHKRFKPFVEDELPNILKGTTPILAHPGDYPSFPQGISEPLTLVIGPEGSLTEYEVNKFEELGFQTHQCGKRILRMETAVVTLLSQHKSLMI